MASANRPVMTVQVDFVNDPSSATETWTDITAYCRVKGLDQQILNCTRGRNYELARTQAGTVALSLDNTDGRFDPNNLSSPYVIGTGNPGSAPGQLVSMRRIRIQATWQGTTYNVWRGYVEDWPQEWETAGFFGTAKLTGTDAISPLSAIDLQALPIVEMLKDSPLGLYRCNDALGSVAAANISSYVQPNSAMASALASGGDNFAFGSTEGIGNLAGDPSTSLSLSPTSPSGSAYFHGYFLKIADQGVGPLVNLSGGCTLEIWFKSSDQDSVPLFTQVDAAANQQAQFIFNFPFANDFAFVIGDLAGNTTGATSTSPNYLDGNWHHAVGTLDADLKTVKLYIDGALKVTNVAPAPMTWNTSYASWVGAGPAGSTSGYNLFSGNVKNVAVYQGPLSAARILAHFQAGNAFSGESSGSRINRLLDAAAWPSALRNVATGDSSVGTQVTDLTKASEALQEVVETERGCLFVSGDGKITFTNRQARYNGAIAATFGENAGEFHYIDGLQIQRDPREIYNDITVSRPNGITVHNTDPSSQLRYFPRSMNVSTVAVDDAAVVYTSEYLLARYKDQISRIPQIVLEPTSDTSLWPQVLGREIGDRITVNRRPGGAKTITADYFVESVQHTVTGSKWLTTWLLSPASIDSYFELDSMSYGRLSDLNNAYTVGPGGITAGATTLTLAFTASDPAWTTNAGDLPLTVQCEYEQMTVTAVGASSGTSQVLTVTRGVNNTTAVAHSAGAVVNLAATFPLTL